MKTARQFIDAAQGLDLTGQEALVLEALLAHGDMSGYEVAKQVGISRSNAYHALASLTEKGFAYRSEGEASAYSALPPEDIAAIVRSRLETTVAIFLATAPARRTPPSPFLTVSGHDAIVERIVLMVDGARDRVYASMAREELELAGAALERASKRGIKVVIIGPKGPEIPGAKHYTRRKERGRLRLIADGALVLTGELTAAGGCCVYSANPQLVALIKDSLTDEMALSKAAGGQA